MPPLFFVPFLAVLRGGSMLRVRGLELERRRDYGRVDTQQPFNHLRAGVRRARPVRPPASRQVAASCGRSDTTQAASTERQDAGSQGDASQWKASRVSSHVAPCMSRAGVRSRHAVTLSAPSGPREVVTHGDSSVLQMRERKLHLGASRASSNRQRASMATWKASGDILTLHEGTVRPARRGLAILQGAAGRPLT